MATLGFKPIGYSIQNNGWRLTIPRDSKPTPLENVPSCITTTSRVSFNSISLKCFPIKLPKKLTLLFQRFEFSWIRRSSRIFFAAGVRLRAEDQRESRIRCQARSVHYYVTFTNAPIDNQYNKAFHALKLNCYEGNR